ncbi:MAG: signal peptidase II [Candidatus Glassbacteria bacterium]
MTHNHPSFTDIPFKTRIRLFLFLVPAVFFLDFVTKQLVESYLEPYGKPVTLIPQIARFRFIYNQGIAFGIDPGFLSGWLLALFSAAVAAALTLYILFGRADDRPSLTALCLIVGGAFGNLYDRLLYGRVVDFIEIGIRDLTWPVFNVADMAVTIGAVLLAVRLWVGKPGRDPVGCQDEPKRGDRPEN